MRDYYALEPDKFYPLPTGPNQHFTVGRAGAKVEFITRHHLMYIGEVEDVVDRIWNTPSPATRSPPMANTDVVLQGVKDYTLELLGTKARDEALSAADRAEAQAIRAEAAADSAEVGIRDDTVAKNHLAPGLRDELDGKADQVAAKSYVDGQVAGKADADHTHTPESIGAAPASHTHTVEQITDLPEMRSAVIADSLALRTSTGNVLVASSPSGATAATSQVYVESYVASQMGKAGFTIVPVEELPANPDPMTIYAVMGPEGVPKPVALATYQMEGIPAAGQGFPGAAVPSSAGWASNPGGWYAGTSHGLTPPVAGIYTIKVTASPANGPVTIYPYVNGGWGTSIPGTGDTATATLHLTTSDAIYYDVAPITGAVPVTITVEAFAGEV